MYIYCGICGLMALTQASLGFQAANIAPQITPVFPTKKGNYLSRGNFTGVAIELAAAFQ